MVVEGYKTVQMFNHVLPAEYDTSLSLLECALKELFVTHQEHLETILLSSGSFKESLKLEKDGKYIDDAKAAKADPLFRHLLDLLYSDGIRHGILISTIFYSLDCFLSTTSRVEASRVSRLLYIVISDMVIIDKALTAIKYHRPRCTPANEIFIAHDTSPEEPVYDIMVTKMQNVDKSILSFGQGVYQEKTSERAFEGAVDALKGPLDEFLKIPVPTGRANRQALEAFDKSHAAMQKFWHAIREWRCEALRNYNFPEACMAPRTQCFTPSTSSKFQQQTREERQALVAAIEGREQYVNARASQEASRSNQTTPTQTFWGTADSDRLVIAGPKDKQKTKAVPAPPSRDESTPGDDIEDLTSTIETTTLTPKVEVSKDSMRLLQRMSVSSTDSKANKGSVKWDDLVAALLDAGFRCSSSGGSAVTFRSASGQGSIVFHRPHPEPIVDAIMSRSMGKRLTKWFKWDAETFVERAKK